MLQDSIYAQLRSRVICGQFFPGEVISMRGLCAELGTSIMPVRDALKRLRAERALETLPNRSARIPLMSRQRFKELLHVRLDLEPRLARMATRRLEPVAVQELARINESMLAAERAGDRATYFTRNQQFHFLVYRAAQSQVFLPIVESLWLQVGPFLNWIFGEVEVQEAPDYHAELLRALRLRDSARAAAAVASDISEAANTILAKLNFGAADGEPASVNLKNRVHAKMRVLSHV
jgi:DNA-binding GntR family transcriptional regulator